MNPADHLGLVGAIAKRYPRNLLAYEDLVQAGVIGLMRAVEKFKPELGFAFTTYASFWVRQAIRRALSNTAMMIRLPVHKHDEACRQGTLPVEPTSLDAERWNDGTSSYTLYDLLPCEGQNPEDEAARVEEEGILRAEVSKLTERERTILHMRFTDGLTLAETGEHFGLTRERIRQIEGQALRTLKTRLERAL